RAGSFCFFFFFFFSSRRRHTSWPRDWSSDVCSSDLLNRDDHPFTAPELQEALRGADALLPTVTDRITTEELSVEPLRARILANFGVGYNHIDVHAAKARGLVVTNTPEVLTDDTADDAVMLMLMVARRAGEAERHVRSRQW